MKLLNRLWALELGGRAVFQIGRRDFAQKRGGLAVCQQNQFILSSRHADKEKPAFFLHICGPARRIQRHQTL